MGKQGEPQKKTTPEYRDGYDKIKWHSDERSKCTYADRYQAKRAPTCGCVTCKEKFDAKNS